MSNRKSKRKSRNSNNSDHNNENSNNNANGNNNTNSNKDKGTITFKFPGRWATLSCSVPFNEVLTLNELQRKVKLSPSTSPPDPQKLFELYFMDEIYPFISKHGQDTVSNKKTITKVWDLQTAHFIDVYTKRSELLWSEWNKLRGEKERNSQNPNYGKKRAKGCKDSNMHKDEVVDGQTVIFKYYSVHSSAKTNRHIFITQPKKEELLSKIKLNPTRGPPSAKQVFETYYYDEILPFLKKSGQQSIRGKKDLSNVWHIQTKAFKSFYEERSRILLTEWNKLKGDLKKSKKGKDRHSQQHNNGISNTSSMSSTHSTTPRVHKQRTKSSEKGMEINKKKKKKKMEVKLIRTLLNFSLFFECSIKENCQMILVCDESERYAQYAKFEQEQRKKLKLKEVMALHLKVFINQFESACLRLHTSTRMMKLCFVNPNKSEEELTIFELDYDRICKGMSERIDHKLIKANIDKEDCQILTVHIPMIQNKAEVIQES